MVKRVMVLGLLGMLSVAGAVELRASEQMKAVVAAYLKIQTELVADKTDTIKAQAHAIGEQAAQMGQPGAALVTASADLEKAADIKAAREAFGPLSEAVVAAARADGWTDVSGLKLVYCPMVKKPWLQTGDKIQNPYFGQAMPGCGELRKMQ
jgi:membrane fusion protein, copper/silver efflux system